MKNPTLMSRIISTNADLVALRAFQGEHFPKGSELEAEIVRLDKLIDYFHDVANFSRSSHDLNVADAARCAHSQYRNEKAAVQHALEAVNDALHWVAGRIEFRESQLALLIDKACGLDVEVRE